MNEWSRKKKLGVALLVVVVASPLLMFTDFVPDAIQGWISENPESSWSPWLEMKLAGLYGVTIRREKKYECYTKYVELFGPDNEANYDEESYIRIELDRAKMTGDIYSKTRGIEELNKFREKYPRRPEALEADKAYNELRLR